MWQSNAYFRNVAYARLPSFWARSWSIQSKISTSCRLSRCHVKAQASFSKSCIERRGVKTQATALLGAKEPAVHELPVEQGSRDYPTVIKQARTNMAKFDNCVLLTRVGGFYELYFEHAEKYAPQLNLKLAQKQTLKGAVAMAGFPFFQLDRYLKILVQDLDKYVAIAEEFPNDVEAKVKSGGLLHDRRVSRVVTPGTLIDENFMDPNANNYVVSVHLGSEKTLDSSQLVSKIKQIEDISHFSSSTVGMAWLDLSTGQFFTQSTNIALLPAVLSRISPRELILHESLRYVVDHPAISTLFGDSRHIIAYAPDAHFTFPQDWLESQFGHSTGKIVTNSFEREEILAAQRLMDYVESRLQSTSIKVQPPRKYLAQNTMVIDGSTMRALEIKTTIREGSKKGTLLHAVRRTKTSSGTRLLDEWLSAPSTDIDTINARLDLVTFMLHNPATAEKCATFLRGSHDSARLVQKFALGRGDADDLIALSNTIIVTAQLKRLLARDEAHPSENPSAMSKCLRTILRRIELEETFSLAERIKAAVDEDGVEQQHRKEDDEAGESTILATQIAVTEGTAADLAGVSRKNARKKPASLKEHYANQGNIWIMKPAASAILQDLHQQLQCLGTKEEELSRDLQAHLNVTSLTLRWTPGLGHICHVRVKPREKMNMTEVRSVSSSKSTHSFHHPAWTALGKEIDQLKLRIRAEERQVFLSLREEVIRNLVKLRANAAVLDELDIACSSAALAAEQQLVRPILNNGTTHKIIGGRHPTVQNSLISSGRTFTANSLILTPKRPLWLLTGPNMAGKSTFLRQNALITILAQTGLFVPAEYAEIGIVDQMFSRIGSADNLSKNESTFMVEMLETATILKHATPNSFVIMDEIGRGTTPEDGEAVAFACLHHLYNRNRCRTLFATHFHGLPELCNTEGMVGVAYYCTDIVEEEGGGFSYDHKLREGINRNSHALKVATIAGLPHEAIEVARKAIKSSRFSNSSK